MACLTSCSAMVSHLEFEETELRLGLPGSDEVSGKKRTSAMMQSASDSNDGDQEFVPPPKAQVVGWPPVRSYRKNCVQMRPDTVYVKVSMDGAPYLRKIDLKVYRNYQELLKALENMFKCTIGFCSESGGHNGSDYAPTYKDKEGDWMLVGDVPWDMFVTACKRLRIMRGSEAQELGCLQIKKTRKFEF